MKMPLLNIIFSFDSVLIAVGLTDVVAIMIVAVVLSTIIMIIFATAIGNFVNERSSIRILALSFLIMIGTLLIAEAFHYEIPKSYAYFAMAFSLGVELLNLRYDKNIVPFKLRNRPGKSVS